MILQSTAGIVGIIALAWIMSENRPRACLKTAAWSVGLQFLPALILLKLPPVKSMFLEFNRVILALQEATLAGTGFVFGYVGGKDIPFLESGAGSSFIFAFQAMPLVLVISALSALLFHWRILSAVVEGFLKVLQKSLRLGGAVGVAAAANVFMGMVGSAHIGAALSGGNQTRRVVHDHGLRHRHHRRHHDGALCRYSHARHARCAGASVDGLHHQSARGHPHRPADGAGDRAAHAGRAGHGERRQERHGRHRSRHPERGPAYSSTSSPC